MKVAVLCGGDTTERSVSLDSGQAVTDALARAQHAAGVVDLPAFAALEAHEAVRAADVVFIALHGGPGEDGRVQAVLEMMGKPYVGARPGPSAVAMDKVWSKLLVEQLQLPTPKWLEIRGDREDTQLLGVAAEFGYPLVFKPVFEGSAVGVHLADDEATFADSLSSGGERDGLWMFERFIPGRELTLGFLEEEPLEVVEIRPKSGFYDYHNKYTKGATDYFCPAELNPEICEELVRQAKAAYGVLRLRDMARLDYRLAEDGTPYFLEANTIPGMTSLSLLPMAAKARGVDFVQLCDRLVQTAARRGPDRS